MDPRDCELDEHSAESLEAAGSKTARKNVEILTGYSTAEPEGSDRKIDLRFLVSPVEIIGSERVEGVKIVRNELHKGDDGVVRPEPTDITDTIPCGLVFRSIGYRGVPLEGVPFDEKGGVDPQRGRPDRRWRRVRRGLDQARAQRDHRHQQARRAGDRRRVLEDVAAGRLLEPSRRRPGLARAAARPSASPTT